MFCVYNSLLSFTRTAAPLTTTHPQTTVVKVRGSPGAYPLASTWGNLLKSEPGLLIAEPMLLQQYNYDMYFFVSELIALVTVLKSHRSLICGFQLILTTVGLFVAVTTSINRLNFLSPDGFYDK